MPFCSGRFHIKILAAWLWPAWNCGSATFAIFLFPTLITLTCARARRISLKIWPASSPRPLLVARDDGTSEQVHLAVVTTNFFQVTGARIAFGRDFNQEDGIPQPPPPPPGSQAAPPARLPVM